MGLRFVFLENSQQKSFQVSNQFHLSFAFSFLLFIVFYLTQEKIHQFWNWLCLPLLYSQKWRNHSDEQQSTVKGMSFPNPVITIWLTLTFTHVFKTKFMEPQWRKADPCFPGAGMDEDWLNRAERLYEPMEPWSFLGQCYTDIQCAFVKPHPTVHLKYVHLFNANYTSMTVSLQIHKNYCQALCPMSWVDYPYILKPHAV
jgi:hypothetical protein